jgi:hypothetical protein
MPLWNYQLFFFRSRQRWHMRESIGRGAVCSGFHRAMPIEHPNIRDDDHRIADCFIGLQTTEFSVTTKREQLLVGQTC